MTITEVDFDPVLVHGPADDLERPRSAGLHLSQIYGSIDEELGTNAKYKNNPMPLRQLQTYRAAGFVWERVMDKCFADALANAEWVRPGEFALDGISCSPDLISVTDWMLGETKFTWKSSRHLETMKQGTGPLWVWITQMKGYCYVIGTQRARLFAFFVNGDYKNMQPQLKVLDFQFSKHELRENWDMLKAHAKKRGWM